MGQPLKSVTIVGGGTAGWLTAALLMAFGRKNSPELPPLEITLIESPDIPTVGVGEATVPGMVRTLRNIGIDEREFFRECNASFKLGVDFVDWNRTADGKPISYINPFNSPPNLRGIDLANYFVRFGAGDLDFVQSYTTTVDMMRACKGPAIPKAQQTHTGYAYHLDAGRFARLLTKHCTANGVIHKLENLKGVEQDENGYITAVELDKTGRHEVELVIDCTGFRGLIINEILKEPFEDYSRYLANDRAMAVQIPHADTDKLEPVTRSTALGAGWSWRVPLYNRVGTGYVFSSAHRTDDEAREEFLAHLGHPEGAEPRVIPMRVGRNRNAWVKNCVAIGLSGGFIEPLESTAIHMIDMGVRWLLTYFPDSEFPDPLRNRYNQMVDKLYNEVRDFICLHYRLGNRTDSQYWIDARTELEVPDRLAENIELWRYNIPAYYDLDFTSLFNIGTYHAVLLGKQVYKTDYAKADIASGLGLDENAWKTALAQLRKEVEDKTHRALDHRTMLARIRGEDMAAKPAAPAFTSGPMPTVPLPGLGAPLGKAQIKPAKPKPKLDPVDADPSVL